MLFIVLELSLYVSEVLLDKIAYLDPETIWGKELSTNKETQRDFEPNSAPQMNLYELYSLEQRHAF